MKISSVILLRGLLLAGLLSVPILSAREITARNPAELTAALKTAGAGDVVTPGKGTWTDLHLAIGRGGQAENPLVIRAEIPGETILNGSSTLALNAPYVTVDGLFFYKGAISRDAVIEFNSHHGIVRNTAVVDYNPAAFETKYYWVFFSGDHNALDRCYFKGKNNLEPLIGNAIDDSRHNRVVRSYFKNTNRRRPGAGIKQETPEIAGIRPSLRIHELPPHPHRRTWPHSWDSPVRRRSRAGERSLHRRRRSQHRPRLLRQP